MNGFAFAKVNTHKQDEPRWLDIQKDFSSDHHLLTLDFKYLLTLP